MYEENFNIQKIYEKMDKYTKFLDRKICHRKNVNSLLILQI